jgi:hypothetical protein
LPASTTKKAIVERFERESLSGYVNPLSFQQLAGVELLTEQGQVAPKCGWSLWCEIFTPRPNRGGAFFAIGRRWKGFG